jgi:hypothetical protein
MSLDATFRRRRGRGVRAGIAVVGLVSGAICLAAPASATSVSAVGFAPGNTTAGATSTWTVTFTPTTALGQNSTIDMLFDPNVNVAAAAITLGSSFAPAKCNLKSQKITGQDVQATLAGGQCSLPANQQLSIQVGLLVNPTTATTYGPATFTVKTSADTTAVAAGSAVTITAAAANKLAFTTSPSSSTAGAAFGSQPTIAVQDQYGNLVTNSTAPVTIAVTSGTGTAGATLACATPGTTRNAANGIAGFTGCSMTTAGTNYTLTANSTGLTNGISAQFSITSSTPSKLAFIQGPTSAFAGAAMTPAVTVQVQDQYGNPAAASTTITLSASSGTIDAGSSATTNTAGLATFSGLTINTAALGLTLTASASGLTATTSATFNVTVKVTTAAATLTETATDAGSGVNTIAYYYCAGYTGNCTSGTGTLIGSSNNAGAAFPITWTSQPTNGAYRLVAVGTDNDGNTNDASPALPVTISN